MNTTIEIPHPPALKSLAAGEAVIGVLLWSPILAPCSSITFRMFHGALSNAFHREGLLSAQCGGAFGITFALFTAIVTSRDPGVTLARTVVESLSISRESQIGYFCKAEGAWRLTQAMGHGYEEPFDLYMSAEKIAEGLQIITDELAFQNRILKRLQSRK